MKVAVPLRRSSYRPEAMSRWSLTSCRSTPKRAPKSRHASTPASSHLASTAPIAAAMAYGAPVFPR